MSLMSAIFANALGGGSDVPISEGGAGWVETKVVEILPPTVCPLVQEEGYFDENGHYFGVEQYVIPHSYDLDGNHDYYLYVDGQEFKYDYNPGTGSGWGRTDNTDQRFDSYFEGIHPGQIDPVPETVTASIKRVSKIAHPIDPKYLTLKIDLLEYGIDVFGMFFAGETEAEFDRAEELFALVNANKDSDINFVIRSEDGSMVVETKASKSIMGDSGVVALSTYAPMHYGTAYAVGLFVLREGTVLLRAKEM